MNLCDKNCNKCPLITHPNSRILTKIFNELLGLDERVYKVVQSHCPNLTVCYDCRIDDFNHLKGCGIVKD